MGKKARTAETTIYQFAGWKCLISCHPQQKWQMTDNGDTVRLERKNVVMEITKEDFEKHWKVLT